MSASDCTILDDRRGNLPALCPVALVGDLRMEVCDAYYFDGPEAALLAVANASLVLAPLTAAGVLLPPLVWDTLQEVSDNLTLVEIFGQAAVQEAMAFGPRVYSANQRRAA
jgi:hypothetical protein